MLETFLVYGFVAISLVWLYVKFGPSIGVPVAPRVQAFNPTHHWPRIGQFEFEVVGESFYASAIASQIPKDATSDDLMGGVDCVAVLAMDDDNKYDDKAVAVYIGGLRVGHLSRDDARSFRRRLSINKMPGAVTSCHALIRGADYGDGPNYGVFLDIKPFQRG